MPDIHLPAPDRINDLSSFFRRIERDFAFYRHLLCGIEIDPSNPARTLDQLPIMTENAAASLGNEVLNQIGHRPFFVDLTTGTTGERKARYSTARDEEAEAKLSERFFRECGISSTDRVIAADIDSTDIYLFYGMVLQRVGVSDFSFVNARGDLSQTVALASTIEPTTLITVPTLLQRLLPQLRRHPMAVRSLRRIIYLGEPMSVSLRQLLENEMGVEVFSFFGATETGCVGGECRAHDGIHIFNDVVVPTVLNAQHRGGNLHGEVAWTTTHFSDHPFVKYPTRDRVVMTLEPCVCGVSGPRILRIQRSIDRFSIFGQTFSHEAFSAAIWRAVGIDFPLQIELLDSGGATHIIFRLPEGAKELEARAAEGLSRTAEIESLYSTDLVTWEMCFSDEFLAGRRKLRRVLDRRAM